MKWLPPEIGRKPFSYSGLPTAAEFAHQCGFWCSRHKYALSRQRADIGADRGLDGAGTAIATIWQQKRLPSLLNTVGMVSLPTAAEFTRQCGFGAFRHKYALSGQRADTGADRGLDGAGAG